MSGYVMLPGWLLQARPSGNAVLIYATLASFGTFNTAEGVYEECRPALASVAERAGMSLSNVKRAIGELLELGAVNRTERWAEDGRTQLPSVYRVIFGALVGPGGSTGGPPPPSAGEPRGGPPVDQNQEPNTKNQDTKTPSASPRGARLPEDWKPGESLMTWYRSEFLPNGWSDDGRENCRREHEKFRDHWLAAAGQTARKKDWDAAWRNWMRRAWERRSPVAPVSAPPSPKPFVQQADEYKATKEQRAKLRAHLIDEAMDQAQAAGVDLPVSKAIKLVDGLVADGTINLDDPNGLNVSVPSLYSGYQQVITVDAEEV